MESEKFHELLSASWKTKKASGITQPKYKGLRIGPIMSTCLRTRSANVQSQENEDVSASAEREFALFPTFCSIQALNGLDDTLPHCEGNLLYSVYQFKSYCFLKATPRNNVYQLSEHLFSQPSLHITLIITQAYFIAE